MNNCIVCGKKINEDNWEKVMDEYSAMLEQVDTLGEDSLTEQEQVLYHNLIHVDCIYFTEDDLPF